jgi:hypothetical protein
VLSLTSPLPDRFFYTFGVGKEHKKATAELFCDLISVLMSDWLILALCNDVLYRVGYVASNGTIAVKRNRKVCGKKQPLLIFRYCHEFSYKKWRKLRSPSSKTADWFRIRNRSVNLSTATFYLYKRVGMSLLIGFAIVDNKRNKFIHLIN